MAVVVPRILNNNLAMASATVVTTDSAELALPTRYLLDQALGKPWRSSLGWTIITGWNDQISFDLNAAPGGELTATVAAGTYATGELLAVAITAALEVADPAPAWACSYSSATGAFTISSDDDFRLFPDTVVITSMSDDIGISETGVAFSHTGTATRHSRHYIACDFGSAQAITSAVLINDNVSASGTVKVWSSATSILDALTAPDATQNMVDRGDHWSLYFNSQSHRYVVFVISDVTNTDGYNEAGIAYLGTYVSPGGYSVNFEEPGEELSEVTRATQGAPMGDFRPATASWGLAWRNQQTSTVSTLWRVFRAAYPPGRAFFFDFDSATPDIRYVFREGNLPITTTDGQQWSVALRLREVLE